MTYDFIFINNGKPIDIYSFQGNREIVLWFKEPLNDKIFKKIEKACPQILKGIFRWNDNIIGNYLYYDEDEIMLYYIKKLKMGFDIDDSDLTRIYESFAKDIEDFAAEVNKISPLYMFLGIDRIRGSNWDKESIGKIDELTEKIRNESGQSAGKDSLLQLVLEHLYQRHYVPAPGKDKIKSLMK